MRTRPTTTQITVRLPTELVEWLDQYIDEDYPSRTALITQALWTAKRRKEADDDLRAFLAIEAAGMSNEDREQLEWLRTRDYPDMGEPAGVLDPPTAQRSG